MKIAGTVAVTSVTAPVQLNSTWTGGSIPISIMGSVAGWRVAFSSATLPAAGVGGDFFTAGSAGSVLDIVADPSTLWVANSSGTVSFIAGA